MEAKGTRITLRITDPLDLNRDVLKVAFYFTFILEKLRHIPRSKGTHQ